MCSERVRRAVLPPVHENIEKLEKIVDVGNCYGAQQMYKSVSARYISAERYSEALDLLESGVCIQFKKGQVTCGAELALSYVDTLIRGKIPYDNDTLDRVRRIYKMFPQIPVSQNLGDDDIQQLSEVLGAAKTRVEGCSSFLKAAIRWSAEFGSHKNGSPDIHVMLAEYLYSESPELDMTKISFHFIRGNSPKKFASTLLNFLGKCYPGEDDLAIARAILMYLVMCNLRDANFVMDEVKKQLDSKQHEYPESELIQFITYLLEVLQRDALPLFKKLQANYTSSIDREPAFSEMLDEIAEKFFKVMRLEEHM